MTSKGGPQEPQGAHVQVEDSAEDLAYATEYVKLFKLRREATELQKIYDGKKQLLEELQRQSDMLRSKIDDAVQLRGSLDSLLKDEDPNTSAQKAQELFEEQRARGEREIQSLKEEKARAIETKQKLQRQKQEMSVYADMLQGVCRLAKTKGAHQGITHRHHGFSVVSAGELIQSSTSTNALPGLTQQAGGHWSCEALICPHTNMLPTVSMGQQDGLKPK